MNLPLNDILLEIEEKEMDLKSFVTAREIIRNRVLEVTDSQCALTPLPHWSGTDAVLGSLDLAIHAMERTINELKELKNQYDDRKATFTLIDGLLNDDTTEN